MASLENSRKRPLVALQDNQGPAKRSYLGSGSQGQTSDSHQPATKEGVRQEVRRLHEAYELLHHAEDPLSAPQAEAWDALLQAGEGEQLHLFALAGHLTAEKAGNGYFESLAYARR